jgi:hypothetical protein
MLLMGDLNVGSELELSALAVGKVWGSLEKRPFPWCYQQRNRKPKVVNQQRNRKPRVVMMK